MKILVVEDQVDLVKNIKRYLELEKFHVDAAHDGEEAEALLDENQYDAIVLDLNLPGKDGIALCREIRDEKKIPTPIVVLTARTAKDSIVEALNLGADDYITKPFDMEELVARIRSVIRRSMRQPDPTIEFREIVIDMNAKSVTKKGKPVKLAPKEYSLLEYLALNKNSVVKREQLIEHVWGEFDALMFSHTVDVHVAYIRRKLGKETITTAPGGYMVSV
jgi:DNA-binding response OmpR family regulator